MPHSRPGRIGGYTFGRVAIRLFRETGFARRVSWMLVGLIAAVWWAMWRGWAILRSDVERKPWDI